MSPDFLKGIDQLAQMQRLSGICDCEPVRYERPAVRATVLSDERLQSVALDYAMAEALQSGGNEWTAQDIADAYAAGARAAERFHGLAAG